MGKRSNFERVERDFYPTPREAVDSLINHLPLHFTYAEPCAGDFALIGHIADETGSYNAEGDPYAECSYANDIILGADALNLTEKDVTDCDFIITNPPWTRNILHPLIDHFRLLRPTWLLIDGGWMFTKQAVPYLRYCSDIAVIGRLKWIPGSPYASKDDCCWYKFVDYETDTIFHGKT